MIFTWLANRRRRKLLAQPFPSAWHAVLQDDVRLYNLLTIAEQTKVRDYVQIFVAEKNWEGCGGLQVNSRMKVVVAALTGILVLGFEPLYFDAVKSILLYPQSYVAPGQTVIQGGVVVEGDSSRLGEAWYRGPIVLSWSDVATSGRGANHGRNVVFHEFAHQLDMLNGRHVDGVPPLDSADQLQRWNDTMTECYRQLVRTCEHGGHTILDCYGATSLGEFFAVATETFFERPETLQAHHPSLYETLCGFYRQDPAQREHSPSHLP